MNIKYIVAGIVCTGLLVSCNDEMNFKEYTQYEKDYVDNSFSRVKALVTNIYTYLDTDFGSYEGAMLASTTDEAEYA